jgi:putative hydrolase
MMKAASKKGLKLLGITEHARGIPGTCSDIYFENLKVVPREMYGVELMLGAEINILDYDGSLSLEDRIIDKLDIRIAGIIIIAIHLTQLSKIRIQLYKSEKNIKLI